MRGNRGAGHVEFIISFLLFIVVVGLFLIFINPIEDDTVFKTSLSSISESIIGEVSSTVEVYGVKIISNEDVITIDIGQNGLESDKVLVNDLKGNVLNSRKINNEVYVASGSKEFIFLNVGVKEDPENTVSEFPDIDEALYQIGSVYQDDLILEGDLIRLAESYSSSYESLKSDLNIPSGLDFSFTIDFDEEESIEAKQEIPLRLNVYSEVFREEVIRINGEKTFVDLVVNVW
tara:strand:- start:185 stop:883 length:699 start_codon:yes stop_codon:yes gene_type:complete